MQNNNSKSHFLRSTNPTTDEDLLKKIHYSPKKNSTRFDNRNRFSSENNLLIQRSSLRKYINATSRYSPPPIYSQKTKQNFSKRSKYQFHMTTRSQTIANKNNENKNKKSKIKKTENMKKEGKKSPIKLINEKKIGKKSAIIKRGSEQNSIANFVKNNKRKTIKNFKRGGIKDQKKYYYDNSEKSSKTNKTGKKIILTKSYIYDLIKTDEIKKLLIDYKNGKLEETKIEKESEKEIKKEEIKNESENKISNKNNNKKLSRNSKNKKKIILQKGGVKIPDFKEIPANNNQNNDIKSTTLTNNNETNLMNCETNNPIIHSKFTVTEVNEKLNKSRAKSKNNITKNIQNENQNMNKKNNEEKQEIQNTENKDIKMIGKNVDGKRKIFALEKKPYEIPENLSVKINNIITGKKRKNDNNIENEKSDKIKRNELKTEWKYKKTEKFNTDKNNMIPLKEEEKYPIENEIIFYSHIFKKPQQQRKWYLKIESLSKKNKNSPSEKKIYKRKYKKTYKKRKLKEEDIDDIEISGEANDLKESKEIKKLKKNLEKKDGDCEMLLNHNLNNSPGKSSKSENNNKQLNNTNKQNNNNNNTQQVPNIRSTEVSSKETAPNNQNQLNNNNNQNINNNNLENINNINKNESQKTPIEINIEDDMDSYNSLESSQNNKKNIHNDVVSILSSTPSARKKLRNPINKYSIQNKLKIRKYKKKYKEDNNNKNRTISGCETPMQYMQNQDEIQNNNRYQKTWESEENQDDEIKIFKDTNYYNQNTEYIKYYPNINNNNNFEISQNENLSPILEIPRIKPNNKEDAIKIKNFLDNKKILYGNILNDKRDFDCYVGSFPMYNDNNISITVPCYKDKKIYTEKDEKKIFPDLKIFEVDNDIETDEEQLELEVQRGKDALTNFVENIKENPNYIQENISRPFILFEGFQSEDDDDIIIGEN